MEKLSIFGLEHYYKVEIEHEILSHIEGMLDGLDVQLNKVAIIGSRMNGNHRDESDLDIAVEYSGEEREDDVFNNLMEEELYIEGIKVDFLPYSDQKWGGIGDRNHFILYERSEDDSDEA